MSGIVKRHPDGFGFFIPDDPNHPDAYIPAHFMKGVMTQDRVTALIDREGRKDRFCGKIISIDKRYWSQIVAPIEIKGNRLQLIDTEGAWGQNIIVEVLPDTKGIKPRDLVLVELTNYSDSPKGLTGRLIKVLGTIEQAQFDVERIARTHGIPFEFSKAALEQAKKFKPTVSESDLKNRKNLQKLHFVTIDGATAKDFDDAIYVERSRSGWTLFVAIADVSHYVKPGSSIDKDAYERGTSSYFPNFVIPMLPEILSNELCSLKPNVVRLAFVCEIQIDYHGNLKKYDFYEASICSHARVTYGQAQEILDGISVKGLEHVEADILTAQTLAQLLLKKRLAEGSLDLEIPEIQVLVDALGEPVDIIKTHRLFSHRMIEEFMLIANVATARFFEDHKITGIYRVHEDPRSEALEHLAKFSKSFGLSLNLNSSKLQIELRNAMNQLKGSAHSEIFSNLVLRSMKQAKYSAENIGHFGLAFSHYSHFTSPIRRYPDLIAHRLIKAKLKKEKKAIPSFEDMQEKCTWLSSTEQRAVKAERAIINIKKARLMQKYLGREFVGVVSSVTKFGIFVTLRQLEVEGLVHIDNLSKNPNSKWEFDEDKLILFERRSGKHYQLGDEVTIQVAATNVMDGKIDFVLAGLHYTSRDKKDAKVSQKPTDTTNSQRPTDGPKSGSGFDPGAKLLEALRKKGLKPSHQVIYQEFGRGITQDRFTKRSDKKNKKGTNPYKGMGKSKNKKSEGKRK
jgi:ribonuclease R